MEEEEQEAQAMAALFEKLLYGHGLVLSRSGRSPSARAALFERLIEDFAEARESSLREEQRFVREELGKFRWLLAGYQDSVECWRKGQEETADDFNLLEVMQLTRKEIRHSMVLAWLLDRDLMRFGTHAQGNLGFRLFLAEFGLPMAYADAPYRVRREVAGDESRVDIEVAARGRFLIHIENKIFSGEGRGELDREWSDLQRRGEELGLSASSTPCAIHALFLTPQGEKPSNPGFRPISWSQIAGIFERFAACARPPDVQLFCSHYARGLLRFVVRQPYSEEDLHAQGSLQ